MKVVASASELVKLKIAFWREAATEEPKMRVMEQRGKEIIEKMYKLNRLYGQTIKGYEQKIHNFEATVVYTMFLISATNFKEYAQ